MSKQNFTVIGIKIEEDVLKSGEGFFRLYHSKILATGLLFLILCGQTAANAQDELQTSALSPTGTILFSSNRSGNFELYTVKADGSKLKRLTFTPGADEYDGRFSRDGKSIVFVRVKGDQESIYRMDINGKNQKLMFEGEAAGFSWKGSALSYAQGGDLFKLNLNTNKTQKICDGDIYTGWNTFPDWSPNDRFIVYMNKFLYTGPQVRNIHRIKSTGDESSIVRLTDFSDLDEGYASGPRWSPDGKKIVFHCLRFSFLGDALACDSDSPSGDYEIYTMNPDGSGKKRLTQNSAGGSIANAWPVWSPDGAFIAYRSGYSSASEIYIIGRNGKTIKQLTKTDGKYSYPTDWTADASSAQ